MTLRDFAETMDYVTLWFTSQADPTGDTTVLGYPDLDFADRRGLLDCEGRMGIDGRWYWNEQEDVCDDQGNAILRMVALVNQGHYECIVSDYEGDAS